MSQTTVSVSAETEKKLISTSNRNHWLTNMLLLLLLLMMMIMMMYQYRYMLLWTVLCDVNTPW